MKKIILSLFILLLCGCQKTIDVKPTITPDITPSPEVEDIITIDEASLVFMGDGLLHGAVYKDAYERHGDYIFDDMFENIMPLIKDYDLKFYNQETILSDNRPYTSYPQFNGPTKFGDFMVNNGFNLVNLASNHSMDYYANGVIDHFNYWNSKDVLFAGINDSADNVVPIKTVNNISYAMLAYTYGTNGIEMPDGMEYLVNIYDKQRLIDDIEAIRPQVDFLIVSMHWGDEYSHQISQEQLDYANLLADLNVDLVIGTHAHVIQPIQWIDDTLIYYGLGNMISAQIGDERLTGAIGSLNIRKTTINGQSTVEIIDPFVDLIYTKYDNNYRNLKLYPYSSLDDSILNQSEKKYQYFTDILTSIEDIPIGLSK